MENSVSLEIGLETSSLDQLHDPSRVYRIISDVDQAQVGSSWGWVGFIYELSRLQAGD